MCVLDRRVAHMEKNCVFVYYCMCVWVLVRAAVFQVWSRTVTSCQQGAVQEHCKLPLMKTAKYDFIVWVEVSVPNLWEWRWLWQFQHGWLDEPRGTTEIDDAQISSGINWCHYPPRSAWLIYFDRCFLFPTSPASIDVEPLLVKGVGWVRLSRCPPFWQTAL